MKSKLQDIIEAIPDFDDLTKLVEEIQTLSFKKMQLENSLEASEAETFRTAMSKPLENGKFPSSSFVINAYSHTGLNGELVEKREELARVSSMLERTKLLLSLYRDMMEMFRTVSANERNASSF
jgi:hypothetical protein